MKFHPIGQNDVHLWFPPRSPREFDRLCREGFTLLVPDEIERHRSFRDSRAANQFLLGRVLMRRSLAAHLALRPEEFRFVYGPNGKPDLRPDQAEGLVFSLSHSRSDTILAVARAERIGADIEQERRAITILRIARQLFSEAEKRQLYRLGAGAEAAAVILWCLKESIVKASGCTIWAGMSGVSLARYGRCLQWLSTPPNGQTSEWLLVAGRDRAGSALAVALQRSQPILRAQKLHCHILAGGAGDRFSFEFSSASALCVA